MLKDFKETYIDHPENRAFERKPSGNISCRYKMIDGRRCAVGRYITNERYDSQFEDQPVGDIYEDIKDLLPVDDIKFWEMLQATHDGYSFEKEAKPIFNVLVDDYCPNVMGLKIE